MLIEPILEQRIRRKQQTTESTNNCGEQTIRSIIKAISWRAVGTLDTIVISLLLTGELTIAVAIGSIEVITKMVLYFCHERVWNSIKWGKQ
jgi:uncharacterized membrane protein